jgi:hypothetical protein
MCAPRVSPETTAAIQESIQSRREVKPSSAPRSDSDEPESRGGDKSLAVRRKGHNLLEELFSCLHDWQNQQSEKEWVNPGSELLPD